MCSRPDDGQLLLLVLVYAVIAGLLVTVVVNLSRAYLARRTLVAAADAAALAAANAPDLQRIYAGGDAMGGGPGSVLPLSPAGTRAAVQQYARDADLRALFPSFRIVSVTTDGRTVDVTLAARIDLPFANVVSLGRSTGYWFDATAHATTPLTR